MIRTQHAEEIEEMFYDARCRVEFWSQYKIRGEQWKNKFMVEAGERHVKEAIDELLEKGISFSIIQKKVLSGLHLDIDNPRNRKNILSEEVIK